MSTRDALHTSFLPAVLRPSTSRAMKWQRRPAGVRPFLVLPLLERDATPAPPAAAAQRPRTATLERPALLDAALRHTLDMSLVRKEGLARARALALATVAKREHSDSDTPTPAPTIKVTKLHQMHTVKTRHGNDPNNNTTTTPRARVSLRPRPITTSSALPAPCTTCGRPDAPERFHSHPATPAAASRLRVPVPSVPPPPANKTGVQKPRAIRYKPPGNTTTTAVTVSVTAEEKKMRGPHTVRCYVCSREFGTRSLPLHEPKCLQKWERENATLPRHLQRPPPVKPDHALTPEQWNQRAWETSQALLAPCDNCGRTFLPDRLVVHQRSCKPDQHHRPPPNNPNPNPSPNTVQQRGGTVTRSMGEPSASAASPPAGTTECYICGRRFGSRSITIHEPQCLRKWRAQNDKLPPAQRRPEPVKGGSAGTQDPGNTASTTSIAAPRPATAAPRKPTLPCYICGREFGSTSLYIHEPQCLRKWRHENDKLPPAQRRTEPQRPDIKFTDHGAANSGCNVPACIPLADRKLRAAAGQETVTSDTVVNRIIVTDANALKFEDVEVVPDTDGIGYTIRVKLNWAQEECCCCQTRDAQPAYMNLAEEECCCCQTSDAKPAYMNWADKCRQGWQEVYEIRKPKNDEKQLNQKPLLDKEKESEQKQPNQEFEQVVPQPKNSSMKQKSSIMKQKSNLIQFDENQKQSNTKNTSFVSQKSSSNKNENSGPVQIINKNQNDPKLRKTNSNFMEPLSETVSSELCNCDLNQSLDTKNESILGSVQRSTGSNQIQPKNHISKEELQKVCQKKCQELLNLQRQNAVVIKNTLREDLQEVCLNTCKEYLNNLQENWIKRCEDQCLLLLNNQQEMLNATDNLLDKCRQYCDEYVEKINEFAAVNKQNEMVEQCVKICNYDSMTDKTDQTSLSNKSITTNETINECLELFSNLTDDVEQAQSCTNSDCVSQNLKVILIANAVVFLVSLLCVNLCRETFDQICKDMLQIMK